MNRSRDRQSLWRTGVGQIVGLLLYVGVVELLVRFLTPTPTGWMLLGTGVVMALIPAVLWMSFFYVQDRQEQEPRYFVLAVAVLAALLGAAIGQPLLEQAYETATWIGHDPLTEILGSILVVGFTQMFLIYAAVRFSIFYSAEFDQRIDGIVYGTAAGVGYATLLNVSAVIDGGGINLQGGVIRVVVTALVYSALGGLIGYVIARGKFDVEPVWWTPLGVALAASITGVFLWLRGAITQTSLQISADGVTGGYNPFPALLLALALAMALLGLVLALTRRANRLTVTGADSDTH